MAKWYGWILGIVLGCVPVYGFQVELPKSNFDTVGSGKTRSLLITNKEANILAVEISVVPRTIDVYGKETLGEPSPDFDVYPAQVLVNPGDDAYVTLVWKGSQPPSVEQSYRVVSKEVPFQDSSKYQSGNVQLIMGRRFLHAAYVTPPKVLPDIRLLSLTPSANKTTAELVVVLENAGKVHKIVSGFEIKITHYVEAGRIVALDKPIVLRDPVFRQRENLLVGGRRQYVVAWPAGLPKRELRGELTDVR